MKLDKRNQMIQDLVDNMDNWDQDTLVEWAKDRYLYLLDEMLPSELEIEYQQRFDK